MAGSDLARKEIRDNIKSILLGNTNAGSNIFISRVNKAFIEELPAVFIWTPLDSPDITGKSIQNFNRNCQIQIDIVVAELSEAQTIQDEADVLAGQVEDLLLPNQFLQYPPPWEPSPGTKIINSLTLGDSVQEPSDDLQEDIYTISMGMIANYYYERKTLAIVDDFDRFGHDYKTGDQVADNLTEFPP